MFFVTRIEAPRRQPVAWLQRQRRAHRQVVARIPAQVAFAHDLPVAASLEVQPVRKIDQLERGLQRVIAVRATAGHVQEEVQLGGGGQAERGLHAPC